MGSPTHIAIILDGNRRWAKKNRMKPWKGHEEGVKKVKQLVQWAIELGIKELTLFSFSTDNFKRQKKEVDYLMSIFRKGFEKLRKDPSLKKNGIRVRAIGRLWMFPIAVQKSLQELTDATKNNKKCIVNFALAYGGRQEIVDAARKIAEMVKHNGLEPKEITEELITKNLYLQSEPEIIIRPGGEKRVSNFLIWQGNYSEWFFLEKMWPDFTKNDLKKTIRVFNERQRRFGS